MLFHILCFFIKEIMFIIVIQRRCPLCYSGTLRSPMKTIKLKRTDKIIIGVLIAAIALAGIIPGLATGVYDFSLSEMVITDERYHQEPHL